MILFCSGLRTAAPPLPLLAGRDRTVLFLQLGGLWTRLRELRLRRLASLRSHSVDDVFLAVVGGWVLLVACLSVKPQQRGALEDGVDASPFGNLDGEVDEVIVPDVTVAEEGGLLCLRFIAWSM